MRAVPVADLAEFAAEAGPWLARDSLRHNVITTGMLSRLSGLVPVESDLLLLRVEDADGVLAGVAIRTPPQAMLLCQMSPPATAALLEFLYCHAPEITAFNGPAAITAQVASAVAPAATLTSIEGWAGMSSNRSYRRQRRLAGHAKPTSPR